MGKRFPAFVAIIGILFSLVIYKYNIAINENWRSEIILLVSLFFTGLIVLLLRGSYNKTIQIEKTVKTRTSELINSEMRAATVINVAVNTIITINDKAIIESFNPAAQKAFGYTKEEVIGKNVKMLMPNPYHDEHDQYIKNYLTTSVKKIIGIGREVVCKRKDGTVFPAELSVSEMVLKDNRLFVGMLVDITERKEFETKLIQISERLKLATTAGRFGVWDYDPVNNILFWDDTMYKLYDISSEIFGGAYDAWQKSLHPDDMDNAQNELQMALSGEKEFNTEFRILTSKGDIRNIMASAIVLRDNQDKAVRMIGMNWDITNQKKAEEEHRQAKILAELGNRAKSDFLASMSHEIRTPMNAIIGMSDLLLETPLSIDQSKYVNTFRNAGENLLEIINSILDLSKIEAGHFELESISFELERVLDQTLEIMKVRSKQKGLELSLSINSEISSSIIGDSLRLKQVIINLIGNAIKFTHQGEIVVKAELINKDDDNVEIGFEVKDTGIGIPADKVDKIFEKFTQADSGTTRKYGGTGLGLTISKKIVEMMGGRIWVESEEGVGSRFCFTAKFGVDKYLKREVAENIQIEQKDIPEQDIPQKILLVDDTEDNRMLILLYLKKTAHIVEIAENGLIALNKFKEQRYDLVLMDIEMPVMDGYTATIEMRKWERENNLKPVNILALSAHALQEHFDKSIAAGCNGHITKPIKKAKLLEIIKKYAN